MHAHAYIAHNFLKTYGQIEITVKKKVGKEKFFKKPRPESKKQMFIEKSP